LPAEVRAQVRWVEPAFAGLLCRLKDEPLTDDVVAEVGREAARPVTTLGAAVFKQYLARPEQWRAAIAEALRRDAAILEHFLPDQHSHESFAWVKGLMTSYFDELLRHMGNVEADHVDTAISNLGGELPAEIHAWTCAQMALAAALDLAKHDGDAMRSTDLIDVAFLRLLKFRDALAARGILLTPFPNETPQERAERVQRYAKLCREVLTEEDMRVLDDARLRTLR
jgi:hypothetical protein